MSKCQLTISEDDVLLEVEDVYYLFLELPKTVIEDIFKKKTQRLSEIISQQLVANKPFQNLIWALTKHTFKLKGEFQKILNFKVKYQIKTKTTGVLIYVYAHDR